MKVRIDRSPRRPLVSTPAIVCFCVAATLCTFFRLGVVRPVLALKIAAVVIFAGAVTVVVVVAMAIVFVCVALRPDRLTRNHRRR